MSINTVGRKVKEHCSRCGILKTEENTYKRTSGYLFHVCKECSSIISKENRLRRMSPEDKDKLLAKYNALAAIIKTQKSS